MKTTNASSESLPDVASKDKYEQIILENLESQNDIEYELGDTLDIKTSIALVVIIFLATQSGGFLAMAMPRHWHNIQLVAVICLVFSGLIAVFELFPRTYKVGLEPDEFIKWAQDVEAFYNAKTSSNPEAKGVEFIRRKVVGQMLTRFAANRAINAMKSKLVTWVFRLTLIAFILNLFTLAGLSTGWYF
jgi:hypothetical protein